MGSFMSYDYTAVDLGINNQSLANGTSSNTNPIATQGADQIEFGFTIVNATGATLDLTATLQWRPDGSGSWHNMTTVVLALGVETIYNRTLAHTTAAVAATYRFNHTISDIKHGQFRLASIGTTAGGATDLLTLTAHVRIPR